MALFAENYIGCFSKSLASASLAGVMEHHGFLTHPTIVAIYQLESALTVMSRMDRNQCLWVVQVHDMTTVFIHRHMIHW